MKYLVLIVLLFSFSSNAAYCVKELTNGNLRLDSAPIENCPSGIIILTKTDYDAISIDSIIATFRDLFEFSVEDFALFNAVCLVAFITGHSIGRVNRILGKT